MKIEEKNQNVLPMKKSLIIGGKFRKKIEQKI